MNSSREKLRQRWNLEEMAPTLIWWVTVVLLTFVVVYPSFVLIWNSFQTADGIGLGNYLAVFQDPGILKSVKNTLVVVIPSTILSTALGVFLAWAVVRTDVPGKRHWKTLLAIPYLIPPFIGAVAWTFILGPVGFFNEWLMKFFGLTDAPINLYTLGGMVFVMTIYRYAVPYVVVLPAMKKIDSTIEEAARVSGANPWRTMMDVTLPLLTPSIMGATLLVFMFILADFGVSAVLGAPNQIRLMTTQIYYLINRPDLPNNLQLASAYSLLLALFGLAGLWAYNRVLRTNKYVVVAGKSTAAKPSPLGKGKWPLFTFLTLIFAVTTVAAHCGYRGNSADQNLRFALWPRQYHLAEFRTAAGPVQYQEGLWQQSVFVGGIRTACNGDCPGSGLCGHQRRDPAVSWCAPDAGDGDAALRCARYHYCPGDDPGLCPAAAGGGGQAVRNHLDSFDRLRRPLYESGIQQHFRRHQSD